VRICWPSFSELGASYLFTTHNIGVVEYIAAGPGSRVRLPGSRTDDRARGGDIDLLVEVGHAIESPALFRARLGARLQQAIGDRRIDIVLGAPNLRQEPIHRVARETGIEV